MPNNTSLDPLEIVNTNNDPIAEAINSVSPQKPTVGPTDSVAMPTESPSYQGVGLADLEATRRAGQTFGLDQGFVQRDQEAREADLNSDMLKFEAGLGEDLYQDYDPNDQFTQTVFGESMRSGKQADFRNLVDQGTAGRLSAEGLQPYYKLDEFRGYRYQPDTGEYKYYDNTPSMLEQIAPQLVKAGIMGVATAGLGNALGGSSMLSGLSPTMATATGKAIAGTGLSAFMGDDVNLENTVKNLASAYGMEQLTGLSDAVSTGSEFADGVIKDTIGSVVKGEDPKKAVLGSLLQQAGDYAADFFDLGETEDSILAGLSDFDKEYLQPIKNYVEETLGVDFSEAYDEIKNDVDGFLDKVPDEIKDLIEGYGKYLLGGAAAGASGALAGGGGGGYSGDKADLVTVQLTNPELVKGFEYDSLDNPLTNSRTI